MRTGDEYRLTPDQVATLRAVMPKLPLFAVVARASSISEAARALGLSRAATSEAISSLEAQLGCTLMHRTTRSLVLTPIGQMVLAHCDHVINSGLNILDVAEGGQQQPQGILRVSCSVGFVAFSLVSPVLARMLEAHQIRVEMHTSSRPVDLVNEQFDVAVRVGEPVDSSLQMRRLGHTREVFVTADDYPVVLEDVHQLVDHPFMIQKGQPTDLTIHREGSPSSSLQLTPAAVLEDTMGLVHMLQIGCGVGVLPDLYLKNTEGLRQVLPDVWLREPVVYALTPPARWRLAKVQVFMRLLVEQWHALMNP